MTALAVVSPPTPVPALLLALQAAGVEVAINPLGDGLTLTGKGHPPADLLYQVRAHKPELLRVLRGVHTLDTPGSPSPALPAHLARLVAAAQVGYLPAGPVPLADGLVTDLSAYVLAWSAAWPKDPAHVLRRLEAAHAVWVSL